MKRGLSIAALGLAVATTVAAAQEAPSEAAAAPSSPFVRAVGERLELEGTPFQFVGTNVAVMHGPAHRAALATTLDAVQADGLSVVRVWALGERELSAPEWAQTY